MILCASFISPDYLESNRKEIICEDKKLLERFQGRLKSAKKGVLNERIKADWDTTLKSEKEDIYENELKSHFELIMKNEQSNVDYKTIKLIANQPDNLENIKNIINDLSSLFGNIQDKTKINADRYGNYVGILNSLSHSLIYGVRERAYHQYSFS